MPDIIWLVLLQTCIEPPLFLTSFSPKWSKIISLSSNPRSMLIQVKFIINKTTCNLLPRKTLLCELPKPWCSALLALTAKLESEPWQKHSCLPTLETSYKDCSINLSKRQMEALQKVYDFCPRRFCHITCRRHKIPGSETLILLLTMRTVAWYPEAVFPEFCAEAQVMSLKKISDLRELGSFILDNKHSALCSTGRPHLYLPSL